MTTIRPSIYEQLTFQPIIAPTNSNSQFRKYNKYGIAVDLMRCQIENNNFIDVNNIWMFTFEFTPIKCKQHRHFQSAIKVNARLNVFIEQPEKKATHTHQIHVDNSRTIAVAPIFAENRIYTRNICYNSNWIYINHSALASNIRK